MDIVGKYCKRVIVLRKGEIVYDGSKDELFRQDDLKSKYNLDYPEVMRIMRHLRTN